MTYTVVRLAAGSYDALLDGALAAALVRDVDRSSVTGEWQVELLALPLNQNASDLPTASEIPRVR